MNISVVMATFNGRAYIQEQICSIVPFLNDDDELIISDDGSNDGTLELIKQLLSKFHNVIYLRGPGLGVVKNFEFALGFAKKDIIMFADQDDIWLPDKMAKIRGIFESNIGVDLVLHDMFLSTNEDISRNLHSIKSFDVRKRKHGVLYNLLYNGYYGCCMCFSQHFKQVILPFSPYTNMYDEWMGLIAEHSGKVLFLPDPLIIHRVHDMNMGKELSTWKQLRSRIVLLISYLDYIFRERKRKE